MTTVKRAHQFMDRQGAGILGLAVVGMAPLALGMYWIPEVRWQQVFGVVWFLCIVAALFTFLSRVGRRFLCPDCGGAVGAGLETDAKPGTPLLRHCKKCDVLWQVGAVPD